ncbi:MAG: hypothetical protein Q9227_001593 [Pyrenula ochraceoflavens]
MPPPQTAGLSLGERLKNLAQTLHQPTASPSSPQSPRAGASNSALANTIGRFVKEYYDASMTIVAGLEIALWFRVLISALTFSKGSWVLLVIYTAFFRARYAQSHFVQGAFTKGAAHVDTQLSNQNTPPAARQAWETVKGGMRSAHDATDLRRYLGGAQSMKKPQ